MKLPSNPTFKAWQEFAGTFLNRWMENYNPMAAAAIAFYVLFALSPIFVFAVTIGGLLLENEDPKVAAVDFLADYVGFQQATDMIESVKVQALSPKAIAPTILSVIVLLWSSSATFIQLHMALNRIHGYSAKEGFKGNLFAILTGRARAMLFSLGTGFILAVGALISTWSHTDWMRLPIEGVVPSKTQEAIILTISSWVIVWIVFTMMMRYLPMRHPRWKVALTGGTIATILFQLGKYIIQYAVNLKTANSAYDVGGVIIVTVLWVFLSAQIVLFSAELSRLLFEPDVSPLPYYLRKRIAETDTASHQAAERM